MLIASTPFPIKRHQMANWIKKEDLIICFDKKPTLETETNIALG
jgi:hypothetical protein